MINLDNGKPTSRTTRIVVTIVILGTIAAVVVACLILAGVITRPGA